jgi:hypothetical protein
MGVEIASKAKPNLTKLSDALLLPIVLGSGPGSGLLEGPRTWQLSQSGQLTPQLVFVWQLVHIYGCVVLHDTVRWFTVS